MEDKKCCMDGNCGKCNDQKEGMCPCHKWCGKCHCLKIIIPILILAGVFCLGTMVGSHRDCFRGKDDGRFYDTMKDIVKGNPSGSVTGSTTVKVLPPGATTPTVTQ